MSNDWWRSDDGLMNPGPPNPGHEAPDRPVERSTRDRVGCWVLGILALLAGLVSFIGWVLEVLNGG